MLGIWHEFPLIHGVEGPILQGKFWLLTPMLVSFAQASLHTHSQSPLPSWSMLNKGDSGLSQVLLEFQSKCCMHLFPALLVNAQAVSAEQHIS